MARGYSSKPDMFKSASVYVVVDKHGSAITVRTNLGQVYQEAFINPYAVGVEFWDAVKGKLLGVITKDGEITQWKGVPTANVVEPDKKKQQPKHAKAWMNPPTNSKM